MYKSPIELIIGKMQTQIDDDIYRAVQNVGINVDREELLKALEYDRGQYEEGFRKGEEYTILQIKNLLPEWLYAAIVRGLKEGEQNG